MERFTLVKETWSNVMDSQRREEFAEWCQENAVSGYNSARALVNTLLGKLRLFLDASVLGHAFANYETLRLFGVSLILALTISWMVGGTVQMVKNKRRKNRQSTVSDKVAKKQSVGSKRISFAIKNVSFSLYEILNSTI
jgi:hypothetical protein